MFYPIYQKNEDDVKKMKKIWKMEKKGISKVYMLFHLHTLKFLSI